MKYKFNIFTLLAAMLLSLPAFAQTPAAPGLEFSKKVHNFGKISISEGAKQCTFEFKNVSQKPIVINNIISSCGCTTPVWPKKPIMPGESGKVEVTYLNDQGPYPFDKSLTVYTSAGGKPIILRISGLAYEKEKSIKEAFPITFGPIGIKRNIINGGQLLQGKAKSGTVTVANISGKSVKVSLEQVTPGLTVSISPETVPGNGLAEISYTVNTGTVENWGSTRYTADVVCNGVKSRNKFGVECMIIDNFENYTREQKYKGSMILAQNSSYSFETASKGEKVTAVFDMRNTGHSPLVIHKADKAKNVSLSYPDTIAPGEKFTVTATIDTAANQGEEIYTITLITNSPNRPLVNLFITGKVN